MRKPERILVYRIGQIGDMVVALPAIWAIREQFPDAHLALLSDAQTAGPKPVARRLLPASGLFDRYLSYPSNRGGPGVRRLASVFFTLRRLRFDALVYLAPRVREPAQVRRDLLFFRVAGIRSVIGQHGFEPLPRPSPGTPLPAVEHEADHLLRRLSLSGVPVPPAGSGSMDLALTLAEQAAADRWLQSLPVHTGDRLVGIGPGSNWSSKCWPEAHFSELGRQLVTRMGVFPVVFGGPEDAGLAVRLLHAWGAGASAAGVLGIREAAAALRRCALYIGNDTGTMHLAAAVGTACVGIFSAQDWPGRWHPYGPGHVVLRRPVPCEGCRLPVCTTQGLRCLREIHVEGVLAVCRQRLTAPESMGPTQKP